MLAQKKRAFVGALLMRSASYSVATFWKARGGTASLPKMLRNAHKAEPRINNAMPMTFHSGIAFGLGCVLECKVKTERYVDSEHMKKLN